MPSNKVLGMWKPETVRANVSGRTVEPFGPSPQGLLCFHESMHFVELISDPRVPAFSGGVREDGTAEENKAALAGNLALSGTYMVDDDGNFMGNVVDACNFPNWIGQQRDAEHLKEIVDGDQMFEVFRDGDVRVDILWKRVIASK